MCVCSSRFRGRVLDRWVLDNVAGAPYEHTVGFELGELDRMATDLKSDMPGGAPFHPLIDRGRHREQAHAYIRDRLGVDWARSACRYCPFALTGNDGRTRTLPRYIAHPDQGMLPLTMEHLAVALNPRKASPAGRGSSTCSPPTPTRAPARCSTGSSIT
ncbi:hypothetical protein [Planomonospora alba]